VTSACEKVLKVLDIEDLTADQLVETCFAVVSFCLFVLFCFLFFCVFAKQKSCVELILGSSC
jgi:hypothetical protein